jgi:NADH:ubiquinone oxidoreductase subunit K
MEGFYFESNAFGSNGLFFFRGLAGIFIFRRNLISVPNINRTSFVRRAVYFSFYSVFSLDDIVGQVFALHIVTIAAAEKQYSFGTDYRYSIDYPAK